MKEFFKKIKTKINSLHLICIGIMIGIVALGVIYFPNAICRLIEAGRDFGLSLAYYVTEFAGYEGAIEPTVNTYPQMQLAESKFQPLTLIPQDWDVFTAKWKAYGALLIDEVNLIEYILLLIRIVLILIQFMMPIMMILVFVYFRYKMMFKQQNNAYNEDSRAVAVCRRLFKYILLPVCRYLKKLYCFAREKKYIKWSLFLWAFYFNLYTIALEVFAYYFYFLVSFDFINIYRQVYKLLLDLTPMIRFVPAIFWGCIGVYIWNWCAESWAVHKLHHNENKNRGFCNARQIFIYIIGLMGAGKTTQGVDMALTYSVQMRDDAFEVILENDLRFPMFPWINFENALKKAFENREIYNIPKCKKWVRQKKTEFLRAQCKENIFDYDFETYAMRYYNRLSYMSIWEALEEYAQAYFIYTIQSSLLISTFSIREDVIMYDIGNFPMWNHDFFARDARLLDSFSKHAHIFDQDMVRLGNLMVDNNPHQYAFGFGVYFWDELDKERKNSIELQEVRASAKECNQKNDLMEPMIKVIRHGCMIGRRNFVKCIGTGQRADDLGAKLRGVCELINIAKVSENETTLPFWAPYFVLNDFFGGILGKFSSLYYQYRFNRSDNVLPMQGYHYAVSKVVQLQEIVKNRFGLQTVTLEVEVGKIDGRFKKHKYYRQFDKVYKERFVSDASGGVFDKRGEMSEIGLMDLPCYSGKRATAEELDQAHLHFWNEHKKVA